MRKILVTMCMALGLCASAQEKGDMAAGLNLGVTPCLESGASVTNFGIGAKFQYILTNPIRLEAAFDYGLKNKEVDVMTIGINGHYLFKLNDKFNIYPLVGLGYAHLGSSVSFDDEELGDLMEEIGGSEARDEYEDALAESQGSASASKLFFNMGVGAEYALNDKLSVGAEIKYQYIKDFCRLPINIGVTYRF